MPAKTKTPQKENLEEAQNRDLFQTPNYAVDIIVPFLRDLQSSYSRKLVIWECAAGERKISNRLEHHRFEVVSTDIQDEKSFNFLTDIPDFHFDVILTNVPFSLKKKFFDKCIQYDAHFMLLLPADYSGWLIDAVENQGCEKIIPTRRIDYITPNILYRIWEGESWNTFTEENPSVEKKLSEWKKHQSKSDLLSILNAHSEFKFNSIYDVPEKLLRKYSSSDFHSMWLTKYFNLFKTETFVELTNEMKNNI